MCNQSALNNKNRKKLRPYLKFKITFTQLGLLITLRGGVNFYRKKLIEIQEFGYKKTFFLIVP